MPKARAKDPITGLTYNEKAFVEEYVRNGYNGTQAYITVYGTEYNTANSRAHVILKKPEARNYIMALQKDAFEEASVSAERIALKLAEIAFADKKDESYSPQAQLKALDLLQKQFGLQNQKITADVNNDINISIGIKNKETDIDKEE